VIPVFVRCERRDDGTTDQVHAYKRERFKTEARVKNVLACPVAGLLVPLLSPPFARVAAPSPRSTTAPDDLFRTVAFLDAALFDAYNKCDLAKFSSLLADDVEFYHDKGGLTLPK